MFVRSGCLRAVGLLGSILLLQHMSSAQEQNQSLAFSRAKQLRRGINTSLWFAQTRDYSSERLRTFTAAEDLTLIAALGFDHIRLSVDATPLAAWQRSPDHRSPFLEELDRVMRTALGNRLSVVIDIHPESDYKAGLQQGSMGVQRFTALWRDVAAHYAGLDPEHVFFEMMNEPEQNDPYRWNGIQAVVADAIRGVAPRHTIIATGAHYSGLRDLLQMRPLSTQNVIYTFHDYEPFAFTHQGATWTSPEVQPLRSVPYPSSPDTVDPLLQQEPDLSSEFFLSEYGLGRWDLTRVKRSLAFANQWSKRYGVPVYCGEFGVLRDYAPAAMRVQWIRDMRLTLEDFGIGWAMWDYQANFGIVRKENGRTIPDGAIVDALGLHSP